jgi:type I restriction enzyme R subunit
MNKKQLTERDICTKYITPALERAGWDSATQIREEFPLNKIVKKQGVQLWLSINIL